MTGVELIAIERQEQLDKHGRTIEHDTLHHKDGQLKFGALYALGHKSPLKTCSGGFDAFMDKVSTKTELEKLIIAGALIAAEIDRLNN